MSGIVVIKPMRVTTAKGGSPHAAIGTAVGSPRMTMHGATFGIGDMAALCAVEPFTDVQGRKCYCVTACATCRPDELAETEAELRRQLALADNPPKEEREGPKWLEPKPLYDSDVKALARRTARKQAEAEAQEAERARLDRLGAGYVAKSDTDVDPNRLKLLMASNRITASARETRGLLHQLRNAIEDNQLWLGPQAEALARAIQAA